MIPENMVMGILFFSQTALGILGNWSLLLNYLFSLLRGKHLMPKDLIIKHLIFANSLAIISRGIPQMMSEFGMNYFFSDLMCKLVVYFNRVARGISLSITCLLSCFQAITISPSNVRWMKFKHRATKYIGPTCSLSWLVHLLLNVIIPLRVTGSTNRRNVTKRFSVGFCVAFVSGTNATPLYVLLFCLADGLCFSLMVWASGFMVTILYRHKRQVQYLHSAQQFPRCSPEVRATRSILILVCTFVTFYSVSSILLFYTAFSDNPSLWAINIFKFLESCFPTISPFVLISNNNSASKLSFLHCGKT